MKYLSVCSGIEAASVAWPNWTPVAFSEIEPFPSAVLAHHYPNVPNWGDMTKYQEWPDANVDVFVGGTPCQSFSVAGLRKGLADPRGNLMLTYLAIAQRYRPRWLVWENVPGVLSSAGGRDFGAFLTGLGQLGYGWAYRVLDAQYFGVAQRRRRVFVVGCLGGWQRAAAVLFERHSLSGHPAPSREAGKRIARGAARSTEGSGFRMTAFGEYADDGTASAMKARDFKDATDLIAQPVAVDTYNHTISGDCAGSLTTTGGPPLSGPGVLQAMQVRRQTPVAQPITFGAQMSVPQTDVDLVQTLQAKNPMAVAQPVAWDEELNARADLAGAMLRGGDGGRHDGVMTAAMQVRRLTPVECERLQGFPDGYTAIPWRGKPADQCPDGPRYKALGNSMAVPVMRWIGNRIQSVNSEAI